MTSYQEFALFALAALFIIVGLMALGAYIAEHGEENTDE